RRVARPRQLTAAAAKMARPTPLRLLLDPDRMRNLLIRDQQLRVRFLLTPTGQERKLLPAQSTSRMTPSGPAWELVSGSSAIHRYGRDSFAELPNNPLRESLCTTTASRESRRRAGFGGLRFESCVPR